jgi:hypothetical protein
MLYLMQAPAGLVFLFSPALRATYNINPGPIAQNPTDRSAFAPDDQLSSQ